MTIQEFNKMFPTDDACLKYIFKKRFPTLRGYKRVKNRPDFYNSKGHQIHPLSGTIFQKTTTPLKLWFYAIYLFSQSKHGVSGKELQRQIGVNYKTAWRMCRLIRSLMSQDTGKLFGVCEADETYIGPVKRLGCWHKPHVPIVGAVERNGRVRAKIVPDKTHAPDFVRNNVRKKSILYTDYAALYNDLNMYKRGRVMHSKKEYARGDIHTNTIEGFWGQLKRSLRSTHHAVSKKYLQLYVDERVFFYNHRNEEIFLALLNRI